MGPSVPQRSGSYWSIEPTEATVGPEQTLSLRLTAVLDDPLRFYDVLVISVLVSPLVGCIRSAGPSVCW